MSELKFIEGKYGVIETLPDVPVILMSGKRTGAWIREMDERGNLADFYVLENAECGLHYGSYTQYWEDKVETLGIGKPRIYTTQSREFIRAAHQVFSEIDGYPFCYIRVDWVDYIKDTALYWELIAYEKDVLEASFNMNIEIR